MTAFVHSGSARHSLICGEIIDACAMLPAASFDAVLCDPPYGLSFMAKRWDYDVPTIEQWRAILRVLKPGAPILAFGGTRTYHRLVCALEDAGAEIRDQIAWIYGSGFPKSQDASKALDAAAGAERPITGTRVLTGNAAQTTAEKGGTYASNTDAIGVPPKTIYTTGPATAAAHQWEGYGTALKPAIEPIVLARKPLDGTMAANIAAHGCGPLAIDACRIESETRPKPAQKLSPDPVTTYGRGLNGGTYEGTTEQGRWPANVIMDEAAGAMLDAQSGDRPVSGGAKAGRLHTNRGVGYSGGGSGASFRLPNDAGGASRFFYCAKASRSEREAGLEGFPILSGGALTDREDDSIGLGNPRAGAGRRGGRRNPHPTVKPIDLARYLATLIRPAPPPGATLAGSLLVPWSGVGSELIGALAANWAAVVGIERESSRSPNPEHRNPYCDVAAARVAHWLAGATK